LQIWTEPKATIRQIVKTNPNRSLWILSAIYGFPSILGSFQSLYLGYSLGPVALFLIALVLSPLWGYLSISIWSGIVYWIGKLFRGEGSFQEVRAAYAWSCVPLIVSSFFWVLLIVLFGRRLFLPPVDANVLTNTEGVVLFLILIAKLVFAIWSLVIYLNALAAVQSFSVLKSIGNVLVSGILLTVVLGILFFFTFYSLPPAQGTNTVFQILNDGKMIFSQIR
jgi:hypothetical protein